VGVPLLEKLPSRGAEPMVGTVAPPETFNRGALPTVTVFWLQATLKLTPTTSIANNFARMDTLPVQKSPEIATWHKRCDHIVRNEEAVKANSPRLGFT
jgi:hypothetical protein